MYIRLSPLGGETLGADMAMLVNDILTEQLLDRFEKASIIAGRTPRAERRKQQTQHPPEEMLISGDDDPEHPDREPGLQSLLLDVTGDGICDGLQ